MRSTENVRSTSEVAAGAAPKLRVLMISSEVEPFARTGGLGDAVSGLSRALAEQGVDVLIVTPRYGVTRAPEEATWWLAPVVARVGWGAGDVRKLGVLQATVPVRGEGSLRVCFLDHPDLFARAGIYGDANGTFGDNDVRFVVLSRGALAVAERVWPAATRPAGPDVIHAHDWHAAPAILSARLTMGSEWARRKTVFTIHNLAFQGVFGQDALDRLAFPRVAFDDGTLAHESQVNFVRGAVALADRVTTVSPTYAREILSPREGCGLDAVLGRYQRKLCGILNGIDDESFDPSTDAALAARYDARRPFDGRRACRSALAFELALEDDGSPMFASVSRLTEQKGIDLLLELVPALVQRGARVVLVGQGEALLERGIADAARRYPGRVACRVAFDGSLARRVYAGSDFFVVPSRYEPCGLTQLYAMRYGAIPVVTPVGGLVDTVSPIHALFGTGTGLVAEAATTSALLVAFEDALALYRDEDSRRAAILRAMRRESAWRAPARTYRALYTDLLAVEVAARLP